MVAVRIASLLAVVITAIIVPSSLVVVAEAVLLLGEVARASPAAAGTAWVEEKAFILPMLVSNVVGFQADATLGTQRPGKSKIFYTSVPPPKRDGFCV